MNINKFKEGEEFLYVVRTILTAEIISIKEFKCKKVHKTYIEIENGNKIRRELFKNCYPLEMYQELKQEREKCCIKKYKEQFQKENKTRLELICIVKAAAELLGGNNEK